MARFCRPSLPLGLCLLTTVSTPGHGADYTLQCKSVDGFAHIYADHAVPDSRCGAIAARVVNAYAFAARQANWRDEHRLRTKPLQIRLLGGSMRTLGYAEGANLMVVRDEYLDNPLSEGTLAHELTHIQDARQLRGRRLPSFIAEGRALTIGHAYRMALGQERNNYDGRMAASAATFTANDAGKLLRDYEGGGWDNQAIGTALVEYMRTKWNGGMRGVNTRLSRMAERMGDGDGFDSAFKKEFGIPFGDLRRSYMKHLDDTKNDAGARLDGTIWESPQPISATLPAKPSSDRSRTVGSR